MTPVRPGALVVPAPPPTSAASKTEPRPLNSSHNPRPGAYTACTRAFGDRPAIEVGGNYDEMNQGTLALRLRAELVASQPFEGGVETWSKQEKLRGLLDLWKETWHTPHYFALVTLLYRTIEMRLLNQLSKSTIDARVFCC
jgi:hypothetical protein